MQRQMEENENRRLLLEARRPLVRSSRLALTTIRSRLSIGWIFLSSADSSVELWRRFRYSERERESVAVKLMEIQPALAGAGSFYDYQAKTWNERSNN
ncbi:hypothetical protein D9C73_024210 [Collichthys lucidus]|uniref:Uncharacterized protein n=1 Tax=Collichthys lucidus TaxID=240159 RepID=A0A4U5VQ48_COLLU|nr:hypothetical protein D9C73_024210 [Collichthys lucidus]